MIAISKTNVVLIHRYCFDRAIKGATGPIVLLSVA